jgi:hypothetical protein
MFMKIMVTGQVAPKQSVDHGIERGRFWHLQSNFLQSVVWDPFILARIESVPQLREQQETITDPGNTLLLFASPNDEQDAPFVQQVLDSGGNVMLNHPTPEIISLTGEDFCSDGFGETIISLRERWHFDAAAGSYIYPHMQPFLRLNPQAGQILSRIGGNPDLMLGKRAAIFAGDSLTAVASYIYTPDKFSPLLGDLAELLVHATAHFTGSAVSSDEQKKLSNSFELRRDFHSFGYAYLTVEELDRCYGGGKVDLSEAARAVMKAAQAVVQSGESEATELLRLAFQALERENRKLQPVPAIFTDTLHGGELFPDIGYFEIDWPEHPAEMIRTYMQWGKSRGYRFNVDLGATTVRELALRFPDLFEELKKQQAKGMIEFVNGSCNQPYPPFHSLESQIRQFDVGRQVWRDALDTTLKTYASQEYGFCPQLASVIKGQEYDNAVIRVQNMGDAPTRRDHQINWEAPDGNKLRSLPSHPHKSEQKNEYTYNNLHLKLYLHGQDNLDFAIFTCLGDITFHRPMREELARVCHYAPVFGRFETFNSYFQDTKNIEAPDVYFAMQDFNCDAAFINLEKWPVYKDYTGNYNTNCMNSMAATHLFAAAELIDALATLHGTGNYQAADHESNWEALTHYQGHGTYIVPYYQSGGFLGTGDSPTSRTLGRGNHNVAEYLGPTDFRQVKQVTDNLMTKANGRANETIKKHLATSSKSANSDAEGFSFYNFSSARQRLLRLTGAAGKAFELNKQPLASQDDGEDLLVDVSLPAYGRGAITASKQTPSAPADSVSAGEDYLENGLLRVEFDTQSGTIRKMIDKASGRELLVGNSHAFYFPQSERQVCLNSTVQLSGPLRGRIAFDIELYDEKGNTCRLSTCVSLDASQPVATFDTEISQAPAVEGNQWHNHLGVRFELANASAEIFNSHFNVLEPFHHRQIYSPYLLLAGDTIFLNTGNEFYVRDDGAVSNILIMENEAARRFQYAVGLAETNPVMQSRKWTQPCFIEAISGIDSQLCHSLIRFDSDDIELLSCRFHEGTLLIRMANTCASKVNTDLQTLGSIDSASITTLADSPLETLSVRDNKVPLEFRPWEIQQLRITLSV